jgi:hypothetical protein
MYNRVSLFGSGWSGLGIKVRKNERARRRLASAQDELFFDCKEM